MPELPEVETVRRGLSPILEGAEIAEVVLRRPDLRIPFPPGFAARLAGRRVLSLGRKAKYLLATLDDGTVWITHLGMSGRMAIHDGTLPAAGLHDHVELRLHGGRTVRFTDPRRFGLMTLAEPGALDSHPLLVHLGMDPLSNTFSGPGLAAALAGKRGPIKAALLDQRVVAGLGNIYVCESLYRAGLSPKRRAGTVRGGRAERLARAVKDTLAEAIDAGGSTLRDHAAPDGSLGYFQHSFKVYGREGQPCPDCHCDLARTGGVRRMVQTGRSTFYCPRRQR